MPVLSLLFGAVVGLSLGLTGGGGAIFAVPLLVYGLDVPMRDAVGISLAAVGTTALLGFVHRCWAGQVEVRTGLLFAAAGMAGAPVGSWLAGRLSESLLLFLFAGLMIVVAVRMWQQAARGLPAADTDDARTCRRDASGALLLTSRCTALLVIVGVATGVLSGLFGVGGGFVIVPALVLFSGMAIHRAVGTSLLVIALVSVSGIAAHLWNGRDIAPALTALFVLGGAAGLFAGQFIGRTLSGPSLQKVFVVAILGVATFVLVRNLGAIRSGAKNAAVSAPAVELVDWLQSSRGTPMPESTLPQPGQSGGEPSKEELKAAFKAFKKRLKLTRLEDESKLTRRPTTSGQGSGIVAIQPPNQFSDAVWEALARQGKIKKAGHGTGTYELVPEQ